MTGFSGKLISTECMRECFPEQSFPKKGICEMSYRSTDTVLVAGGDMRFAALAAELSKTKRVYAAGFDRSALSCETDSGVIPADVLNIPERVDILILPMPVSDDGVTLCAPFYSGTVSLDALAGCVKEKGFVFGGRVS
ncbi:MAG: hypothetical protein NC078_06045, partial [Ruminococcus sp.]|nr:hypothetical protein [Ruminococcus sp.]